MKVPGVRGEVLDSKSSGYDQARAIFNVAVAERPSLIVRCLDAADAQAAVKFAVKEGLPLSVRAGGHSVAGHCVAREGLVVDLRALTDVAPDPDQAAVAVVGGGCSWGGLQEKLGDEIGTPGSFDPRVGVAGLTFGGGYGMLSRFHGLASDSLVGADVVTADGELLTTSQTHEPDLLWALRGAGANFGVTTSMRFKLYRLKPLLILKVAYPLSRAKELLRTYRELVAPLNDATTVYFGVECNPDALETVQFLGFHFGDPAEGERILAPFARLGTPLDLQMHTTSYPAVHKAGHHTFPEGHHHAWRAHFVRNLDDAVIDPILETVAQATGQRIWFVLEHLGAAIGRIAADASAFPHRDAAFGIVSALKWTGEPPSKGIALQEQLHAALGAQSLGSYVNYMGRGHEDPAAAYGVNLPRLQQLKQRYDPTNVFRYNVNIRPGNP